jgi:hypothetical protein
MEYFNENGSHPIFSSKVCLPFGKSAAIDNDTFCKLIHMQKEKLPHTKHVEIHNLCHIDKDILLGYDTTGELISSTIHQLMMDEVYIEGDPMIHAIERTMKNDTNRALFLESNTDLCMAILDEIEGCMAQNIEHSDDPTAYCENERVKVFITTIEQRKRQQHVLF